MADQERLSSVDAAWLRMDRPTNLMMICGVMLFSTRMELQRLRRVISLRMLCFHRFQQRVVDRGVSAFWELDPHFDLDWHVREIALPGNAGTKELDEIVGDLISTPLDPSKPMWQFHLIEIADGASALLLRIHHCYGDGFALMHVVMSMTDESSDWTHRPALDIVPYENRRRSWERILGPVTEIIGDVGRCASDVMDTGRNWLADPSRAVEVVKMGVDFIAEAAVIANMTPDSCTRLKGAMGVMKRVAWAEPISLFEVKAVSEALSCSINDVLLACVSGALRAYLQAQGDDVTSLVVRTMVPVNLRSQGPITDLGNHFGLVFLELPINIADPLDRVASVREKMAALKHSQQPMVSLGILAGMGLVPAILRERILDTLADNASAVMTNMPGSRQPRYLAGQLIKRQVFWVPQSGGIGVGMSILSYAGNVDFAIVTDAKRIPDPDAIVKLFNEEFESLLLLSMWRMCQSELSGSAGAVANVGHLQ